MRRCVTPIWAGTDSSTLCTAPATQVPGLFYSSNPPQPLWRSLLAIAVFHVAITAGLITAIASRLSSYQLICAVFAELWKTNSAKLPKRDI